MKNRAEEAQAAARAIYEESPDLIHQIIKEKSAEAEELEEETVKKIAELKANKNSKEDWHFWREIMIAPMVDKLEHLKRAIFRMQILTGERKTPKGMVTPQQIEMAKACPWDQLIEVDRAGFAKCPFHDDSSPSLYTRRGFAHCFSCSWSGDTIKFVMETQGLDFRQAVKHLT